MARKLRIGIDIDDVMCDYVGGLTDFYNRATNSNVKYESITDFDLTLHYPLCPTYDKLRALMTAFAEMGFMMTLKPVPGAIEAVKQLRADGHEVVFLSSRKSNAIADTYRWFFLYDLKDIPFYFDRDKAAMCSFLELDVMIDDRLENLQDCPFYVKTFLFKTPWGKLPRYDYTWEEALAAIHELADDGNDSSGDGGTGA